MYRLATVLALLILIAIGCGGSEDNSSSDTPAQDVAVESDQSKPDSKPKAGKARKAREGRVSSGSDKEDEGQEISGKSVEEIEQEGLEDLPDKQMQVVIDHAVRVALSKFGLDLADVDYADGGRSLTIYITRKTACLAVAKQVGNIMVVIQHEAPTVKSARFMVAGTGQQLGYYVLSCKQPKAPNGPGRRVLDHTGFGGPYTSEPFVIKSERWALEWENRGGSLAVLLLAVDKKGNKKAEGSEAPRPVSSNKPEAGRYEYKGAGRFKIRAYGAARWSVRVKEIR